jgi:hypothetical protein
VSFLHALGDVAAYAGEHVALPVAVAWLTVKSATTGAVRRQIERTDRLVANLDEDLRRWMRDRDHAADVRMSEITQQANAAGVGLGGAIPQARGKVYRIVLHEYRGEASRKLRALDDLLDAEGRWHRWYRRRKGRPVPTLELDDESAAILAKWREATDVDPSRAETEGRLAELERAAA